MRRKLALFILLLLLTACSATVPKLTPTVTAAPTITLQKILSTPIATPAGEPTLTLNLLSNDKNDLVLKIWGTGRSDKSYLLNGFQIVDTKKNTVAMDVRIDGCNYDTIAAGQSLPIRAILGEGIIIPLDFTYNGTTNIKAGVMVCVNKQIYWVPQKELEPQLPTT